MQKKESLSGQSTCRLFIGIRPDDASQIFLEGITDLCREQLKGISASHIRWANPANRHLTLAFLGDTQKEKIPHLKQGIIELAHSVNSFQSRIHSLNPFPRPQSSCLAVGLLPNPYLTALNEKCQQLISELGMEPESKPYRPHITLARCKKGFRQLAPLSLDFPFLAKNIILYQSTPQVEQSHYHPLLEVNLYAE
ncbi:RNA 2',3'-cyclic phosphodiesterase [Microbulbifer sp. THAF38]|uniref:RNA 2',3'-cyclic phosphodiesterase n=1 Tax=Microbulbifer sp. THAF38 TaxID=2587856 RepID=UPI001268708C|nr:RNA 2',3'-cyclic phosphodiesterase [Microbulbifer sp. THAF38]QFT55487.1 2',5' RNA ligase family [Microbulbifer sp. THAF38]